MESAFGSAGASPSQRHHQVGNERTGNQFSSAQAEAWGDKAAAWAKEFFNTQGKDGGCMEGPGYGTYGADTLARFLLALESANISSQLLEHPFFVTLPRYCISQMCPNDKQQTGFGDCWFSQPFPLCMTLLALRGNTDAVWYLHEIGYIRPTSIEQLVTIGLHPDVFAAPKPPTCYPSRAFVDIGYASLRDGYNADAAFMAFKCGPPTQIVGHNHRDHNSFQIHFNGVWIATDPGYVGYFDPPDNGRRGVVIELDGLRHLVSFAAGETTLAGRRLTHDGKRACVSLNAQGKPVTAWLMDGKELNLDGDAVPCQHAVSTIAQ